MFLSLLRQLRQRTADRYHRLKAWRSSRTKAIGWATLYDGGVLVALGHGIRSDDVRIALRFNEGPEHVLVIAHVGLFDDVVIAFAPMPPGMLETSSQCALTVVANGRAVRQRAMIGPGRYAGHIDGIRDYGVEGWVAPFSTTIAPTVCLVLDGIAGEPVLLDRFRPELMRAGRQGGWNGFRLPLPTSALDGRPHHIAVKAGETVLDFGSWAAKPHFTIDSTSVDRFAGWYFDDVGADVPITMRMEKGGVTYAAVETRFRSDLRDIFNRRFASFDFSGCRIEAGSTLMAGPEGSGIRVGGIVDDVITGIDKRRETSRDLLLEASEMDAGLGVRRTIRDAIVQTERRMPGTSLSFVPTGSGSADHMKTINISPSIVSPSVCAIVPVYNGLADLKICLESLIPQLNSDRARAIVIDDCSPDPAISQFLSEVAIRRYPGLSILSNEINLGFIATVNRGFSLLKPGEDAVIVNADTILPPGAIAKLAVHCHARPGIASVTPMSNNATILSFPSMTKVNPPAFGLDVGTLDRAFTEEATGPVTIPTGVGFCMYLNRKALDEVGPFSPEWGRGYCEEVDWCLSARDLGWIHIAATDTFVIHEGSVSFGVEERLAILAVNHVRLEERYPEYLSEVAAFLRADPFEALRISVLTRLLRGRFRHLILHVTHGLGGGTKRYIDDLAALPRSEDTEIAILQPVDNFALKTRLMLSFDRSKVELACEPAQVEALLKAIELAGTQVFIHVNSRLSYHANFLKELLSPSRSYVIALHDYQWYCPRIQLTDGRNFYCGEPSSQVCRHCVSGGTEHFFGDQQDLIQDDFEDWLDFNAGILKAARRLIAPSQDTADRYNRRLGIKNVVSLPHVENGLGAAVRPIGRRHKSTGALHVAVVGAISGPKGFDLIQSVAAYAAREKISFLLTVIGSTCDDAQILRYSNVKMTGRYALSELKKQLDDADPDFVFLSSVWPETYSYVLSDVWDAGYSVVAFDIGAPAERIRASGGGILIPHTRDPRRVLESLLEARRRLDQIVIPQPEKPKIQSLEQYYRQCDVDIREPNARQPEPNAALTYAPQVQGIGQRPLSPS